MYLKWWSFQGLQESVLNRYQILFGSLHIVEQGVLELDFQTYRQREEKHVFQNMQEMQTYVYRFISSPWV